MAAATRITEDRSFLAPPGEVCDWRMAVLFDTASEAGLLDVLPATAADIAEGLGLDPHGVEVVLDALGAFGIVEATGDGRYAPGAAKPEPPAAAVLRHHARSLRQWAAQLDYRVQGNDRPPPPGGPMTLGPEVFLDALAVGARRWAPTIVDACLARFPGARRVLDLGGGHGEYALEFARRGLRATVQDLPTTIEVVQRQGRVAEGGVDLFAGDFFEVLPDDAFDLVFLAGVTHTFDGDSNRSLYRRLRSVMAPSGGLAIVTFLRGHGPVAAIFAVQMLVIGRGGDTHGGDDYRRWLAEAGLRADVPVDVEGGAQSLICAVPQP